MLRLALVHFANYKLPTHTHKRERQRKKGVLGEAGGHSTIMASSGSWESLFLVGFASFCALISVVWQCTERANCSADTCLDPTASTGWIAKQCSFRRHVPFVSMLLHTPPSNGSLASLTRGMCGLGERLYTSPITNELGCLPLRPFPDALQYEIMNPSTRCDTDFDIPTGCYTDRACGRWIGSLTGSALNNRVDRYATTDYAERMEAVRNDAARRGSSASTATTPIGKVRAACRRTLLGGVAAVHQATILAFDYFVGVTNLNVAAPTRAQLMGSYGILVGHKCPLDTVFRYSDSHTQHATPNVVSNAARMPSGLAMQQALRALDSTAPSPDYDGIATVSALVRAAAEGCDPDFSNIILAALEAEASVTFDSAATAQLCVVASLAEHNATLLRAYLRGAAATCALLFESASSIVSVTGSPISGFAAWRDAVARDGPRATGLGRPRPVSDDDTDDADATAEAFANSSAITLEHMRPLVAASNPSTTGATTTTACFELTEFFFPHETDRRFFDALVPPRLYSRMENAMNVLKSVLPEVVADGPIAALLTAETRAHFAERANRSVLRIPGAPSDTWAGGPNTEAHANIASSDGVFVMCAKQARAHFLKQFAAQQNFCDHLYYAASVGTLSQNAVVWYTRQSPCIEFFLGMLVRPVADAQYEDVSLYSRAVAVVAHELGHIHQRSDKTDDLYNYNVFDSLNTSNLLRFYPNIDQTWPEAVADVIALALVLKTGRVNKTQLCAHWSQMWCARTPLAYRTQMQFSWGRRVHPLANDRANAACQTLEAFF